MTTEKKTISTTGEQAWNDYWNKLITDYPVTGRTIAMSESFEYIRNTFIYAFHAGISFAKTDISVLQCKKLKKR